ncbi:MAG: ribulose-bisphosphate carboxylase large subunit [Candidatus Bilamarchaeaceae archaeon]
MVYGGYSYIDKRYEPTQDDFVALFWVEGKNRIEKIAEAIAAESSVGTWTKLKTMNEFVWQRLRARVFRIAEVSANSGLVWIAYPFEHFDTKNIIQFKASVLGNIFGMKELNALVALDIQFPKRYQEQFSGPLGGIEGIRKRIGTEKTARPHLGTIVKPKVGLTPKEFAAVAYEAYVGGCDFVKDDENLVDQDFCKFWERAIAMLEVLDRIKSETGRTVLYAPNISDRYEVMLERLDFLKSNNASMVMLDVFQIGYSALANILNETKKRGLFVHAHRAGYAAEARGKFGINFVIHEKFYRLLGVDQLHVGTGVGKMEGSPLYVRRLNRILREDVEEAIHLGSLAQNWSAHIKPVFPVASGGIDPTLVEGALAIHGPDVVLQAGGGIHGHPGGTRVGAIAMVQAIDAVISNIPLREYAKTHPELKSALELWGYRPRTANMVKKLLEQEEKRKAVLKRAALKQGFKEILKYM